MISSLRKKFFKSRSFTHRSSLNLTSYEVHCPLGKTTGRARPSHFSPIPPSSSVLRGRRKEGWTASSATDLGASFSEVTTKRKKRIFLPKTKTSLPGERRIFGFSILRPDATDSKYATVYPVIPRNSPLRPLPRFTHPSQVNDSLS